jgi:hypothetical protein
VNRIVLAGRTGIAAFAARNMCLDISDKRLLELPETETTAFILSCGRYVSTVCSGNRHDFSVMRDLSFVISIRRGDGASHARPPQANQMNLCDGEESLATIRPLSHLTNYREGSQGLVACVITGRRV